MIYANDQWIQLPTVDLYDTLMMLASVQAAKDMYEKGQQLIKDFNDKYGDFMTPIQKDMDWYNKNVTGRVQQAINNLYASGIDPLRSAEGRAAIQRIVSLMPVGTIQAMKANAATYGEWLKNKAELESLGLYDPNQDEFFNRMQGLPSAEGFSTLDDKGNVRMWNRLSPTKYKSLHDLIAPIVDNTSPGLLTPEEVNSFEGVKYDPMYDYTGVSERMLRRALLQNIPGVYKDPAYQYYREIARQKVAAKHPDGNYTQADVDEQLRNDAYLSVPEYLKQPVRTANPYRQAEYSSNLSLRNSLRLARERATRPTTGGKKQKTDEFSYMSGLLQNFYSRRKDWKNNPNLVNIKSIVKDALRKSFDNGVFSPHKFINLMTIKADASVFSNWLNRDKVEGIANAVAYLPAEDRTRLFGYQEIMNNADVPLRNKNTKMPMQYNNLGAINMRNNIIKDSNLIPYGKAVMMPNKDGFVHVYQPVKVEYTSNDGQKTGTMYYDLGYDYSELTNTLNPNTEMIGRLGDTRASQTVAGRNTKAADIGNIENAASEEDINTLINALFQVQ